MAPHIDAPLADVFALLRGAQTRRGVDLALVSQLFRLKRGERVALLDAVDPERPLLCWRLIQVMSPDSVEAYGSVTHRAIQPTFDLLSALCGRGELAPALQRTSHIERVKPTLDDLMLDDALRPQKRNLCEGATATQAAADLRQRCRGSLAWGGRGAGKTTIAAKIAALLGAPVLAFNPMLVEKGALDDLLRRAQREALIRGARALHRPDLRASSCRTTARSWPSASSHTRR